MTSAPITIEPMEAKYNREVSYLIADGFSSKFGRLSRLAHNELALFFERLLDVFPEETASQRMVALQEGTVIGTLSIQWQPGAGAGDAAARSLTKFQLTEEMNQFGKWKVLKLAAALYFLNHKPQAGECYIADLSVHTWHRGKGVGKLLLQWAHQYAVGQPLLNYLSLHVSGSNQGAKRLYEQQSFRTHEKEISLLSYVLFHEWKWDYMILKF
ncbi:GNAT family N-acetyltransferase [Paenibacillus sp. HW567]|uniref:GNAT family N-acetyltransferase n=1 Tax=Paenibacillus sp. HW567 TaxID=1034769 RepID=UPI00037212D3|nr:GNAT family N-acetyltransferase [Paenibacillus sp. HW567]